MIAHLWGKVSRLSGADMVIEAKSGVGYRVTVTPEVIAHNAVGNDISIRVVSVVKEDAHELYGFDTELEESLFLELTSVPQVGAKLAMKVLRQCIPTALMQHLLTRNVAALTGIKGIGPKVAQRIVDKLGRKAA